MKTIFENASDEVGFDKAIKESLPDERYIKNLQSEIETGEKELKKIETGIEKLVDGFLDGTLNKGIYKKRETALCERKDSISKTLEINKQQLSTLPTTKELKMQTDIIRRTLESWFRTDNRLNEMSYDEKKELLHCLFDGTCFKTDKKLAVYIDPIKRGIYGYEIVAKLGTNLYSIEGKMLKENSYDYKTSMVQVVQYSPIYLDCGR